MSAIPNPAEATATIAALITGRLAPAAIPAAQWPALLLVAVREDLGPLVYWAVKRADPDFEFSPDWTTIITLTRHTAVQNVLFRHVQQRLLAALTAAGISPIWIKGIALLDAAYPEPALRPMSDLDVMVPFAQRNKALAVLQAQGATLQHGLIKFPRVDDPLMGYAYYAYELMLWSPRQLPIDLHFRLPGRLLRTERFTWFWEHVRTSPEGVQTLIPEAHLLYLCGHMILHHGEGHYPAGKYADVHFLVLHDTPDWELLVTLAAELGWAYALERVLTVAQDLFGTPVPVEVLAQLQAQRAESSNMAIALKLRDRDPRGENTLDQLTYIPLWQRVRFVWYTIFPARAFLRRLYALQAGYTPLWPYYLRRWWDLLHVGWRTVVKRLLRR